MKFFKQTVKNKLLFLSITPIIALGVVFLFIGINTIKKASRREIFSTLNGVCLNLRNDFVTQYPNFMETFGNILSTESEDFQNATKLLDKYKENFKTEVTIFYGNKCILTTIRDKTNNRIINTIQGDKKITDCVFQGNTYTSGGVNINNEEYYVSYIPVYYNNNIIGMVFAGLTNQSFINSIEEFIKSFLILCISFIIILVTIISILARKLGKIFTAIKTYLNLLVEKQNATIKMDKKVLLRKDEFGDLGRYAQEAGNQLNKMICLDPLTKTYNRRAGTQFIDYFFDEAVSQKIDLTIVMCDIDHFKKINDTYGHKSGDEVLYKTAKILNSKESIFTIRWGGEEFLLGFALPKEDVIPILEDISKQIQNTQFEYNNQKFNITITFGVSTYDCQKDASTLVVQADKNLYIGKKNGKNTIIS